MIDGQCRLTEADCGTNNEVYVCMSCEYQQEFSQHRKLESFFSVGQNHGGTGRMGHKSKT